jgi:hypothetical protein
MRLLLHLNTTICIGFIGLSYWDVRRFRPVPLSEFGDVVFRAVCIVIPAFPFLVTFFLLHPFHLAPKGV